MNIFIFFVYCIYPDPEKNDGSYRFDVHYVAGLNSADAEQRIVKDAAEHLKGRRFITSDKLMEDHRRVAVLYATKYTNEGFKHQQDAEDWIATVTRDRREDGEVYPATVREF